MERKTHMKGRCCNQQQFQFQMSSVMKAVTKVNEISASMARMQEAASMSVDVHA